MIGYLSGKLVSFSDGTVILSTGGIGFEVACSAQAYAKLVSDGGGDIFVYTAVKEDGVSLYGFISAEEKRRSPTLYPFRASVRKWVSPFFRK